jgi:signal transduction histidine kinase
MSTPARAKVPAEKSTPADPTSEQALQDNEQGIKANLDSFPAVEQAGIGNLQLAEIVDVKLLQSLADNFFAVAHFPVFIRDVKGNMLVGVGWQDICVEFHRANPETCNNCIESDTKLAAGVAPGEFKLYKCKNNMWDIATPLIVCNQHVGNIFSGQFVFDDEPPNVEFFRTQAQRYGFNEEQYLAALESVPRLSREHVNTCMTFLTKLAHMISQNGYNSLVAVSSQQSLAHLASFPELNPNPIFETDLEGRITYLNPSASKRFPALGEMGAGHTLLTGWSSILASLKQGVERSMVREVEADGSVFHQEIHYLPERATVRSYFVDITAHKRAEQALIRSEKLASVGRMAATVAHEINNPLEAVANCIYIAATNPKLPPEVKEQLETADRELKQLSDLTRRTLGFYRENAQPSTVDIRTLVGEVLGLYGSKFKSKDIRLSVEHGGCCAQVLAVAGEIRQVISNLLVNAFDASNLKGSVKIRISRVSLNDYIYIRVTVADTGTGIPASIRSRIFEPFFTTKEKIGTGLGLWVSQQIIEKHNGRIRVRSIEGKGTVFSVFLPELQAEYAETARS